MNSFVRPAHNSNHSFVKAASGIFCLVLLAALPRLELSSHRLPKRSCISNYLLLYYRYNYFWSSIYSKEVCNGGVAYIFLKLGSLKKTAIASLFHSGLHSGTIFLWKKQCYMLFWGTTGYAVFLTKKRPKFFLMPSWFFDNLQLFLFEPFFDQVPNKGFTLENPCQSWTKMEESRLLGS